MNFVLLLRYAKLQGRQITTLEMAYLMQEVGRREGVEGERGLVRTLRTLVPSCGYVLPKL